MDKRTEKALQTLCAKTETLQIRLARNLQALPLNSTNREQHRRLHEAVSDAKSHLLRALRLVQV